VTRAADASSVTGANFSSWHNASAGTVFVDVVQPPLSGAARTAAFITDSAVNQYQRVAILASNTSNVPQAYVNSASGVTPALFSFSAVSAGERNAIALAYKENDFAGVVNGGTVQTDTSGSVPPAPVLMAIGGINGTEHLNGHIKRLAYYPTRLTNAQLQALTA
jgi:hypothetical protein